MSARLERDLFGCRSESGSGATEVDGRDSGVSAHTRQVRSDRCVGGGAGSLREPDLPIASHDEVSRELKLLVDRRETLVAQRTATINRLLWRVHELDPARADPALAGSGQTSAAARRLAGYPARSGRRARQRRARRYHRAHRARSTRWPSGSANVSARWPRRCWRMPGCGELTAAKIIGETAGVTRFHSEAAFARHAGVAPDPGVVGKYRRPGPVEPLRQPPTQRRPAPHRRHPDPP